MAVLVCHISVVSCPETETTVKSCMLCYLKHFSVTCMTVKNKKKGSPEKR